MNWLEQSKYPVGLLDLVDFLCEKYVVDRSHVFVEYSPNLPPSLEGARAGYYDGLLSYREKRGESEFLITVFTVSRDPLLTLAHEFVHMVRDVKAGTMDKHLSPPNDEIEREIEAQALKDLSDFRALRVHHQG